MGASRSDSCRGCFCKVIRPQPLEHGEFLGPALAHSSGEDNKCPLHVHDAAQAERGANPQTAPANRRLDFCARLQAVPQGASPAAPRHGPSTVPDG